MHVAEGVRHLTSYEKYQTYAVKLLSSIHVKVFKH